MFLRNLKDIILKEMKSYFISPIAYVVLTLFCTITGFFFFSLVVHPIQPGANEIMSALTGNLIVTLIFLIPLVTMRQFAEEKKTQTIEVLFSKPVRITTCVIAKFFAAYFLVGVMIFLSGIYAVILAALGNPDFGIFFTSFCGILLASSAFTAVGIFASTLTENQIVASLGAFTLLLIFWLLNWASGAENIFSENILSYMSMMTHYESFGKGIFELKDVVYFLSVALFFLYLSVKSLEVKTWK